MNFIAVKSDAQLAYLAALVLAFTVPAGAEPTSAAIPLAEIGAKATAEITRARPWGSRPHLTARVCVRRFSSLFHLATLEVKPRHL